MRMNNDGDLVILFTILYQFVLHNTGPYTVTGADLHCERHAFVVRADEFPFRFLPVTAVFGIVRGSGLFEIIEIADFLVAGFEDNVPEISDHLHHRPSYVG